MRMGFKPWAIPADKAFVNTSSTLRNTLLILLLGISFAEQPFTSSAIRRKILVDPSASGVEVLLVQSDQGNKMEVRKPRTGQLLWDYQPSPSQHGVLFEAKIVAMKRNRAQWLVTRWRQAGGTTEALRIFDLNQPKTPLLREIQSDSSVRYQVRSDVLNITYSTLDSSLEKTESWPDPQETAAVTTVSSNS